MKAYSRLAISDPLQTFDPIITDLIELGHEHSQISVNQQGKLYTWPTYHRSHQTVINILRYLPINKRLSTFDKTATDLIKLDHEHSHTTVNEQRVIHI